MRNDVYMCDCKCDSKYFQVLKDARNHNEEKHGGKHKIYFNSPYGGKILVSPKFDETKKFEVDIF